MSESVRERERGGEGGRDQGNYAWNGSGLLGLGFQHHVRVTVLGLRSDQSMADRMTEEEETQEEQTLLRSTTM